jgi:putative addiction module component (TIGR02574 family)
MTDYQTILSAASQLPVSDRLQLIDDLAASVPEDHPPRLSEAWLHEIARRTEEVESGAVATESWEVIRARLFARHGVERAD